MDAFNNPSPCASENERDAVDMAITSAAMAAPAIQDHGRWSEAHFASQPDLEDDPRLWDLAAPLAAAAYGAYALHVTMGQLHILASSVLVFVRRLSQLRTYAGAADLDITLAGGHAYDGLLQLYERLTSLKLEDDYAQNQLQLLEEITGVEPLLRTCSVEDQLINDLYASTHGANLLHTAYNDLEMRRQMVLDDHHEIAGNAKDLEVDGTYQSHAKFAADDLGLTATLLDTTQASILVRATRAHHTMLQAVDYLTLQCNIFSREMSVSMDSVPVTQRSGKRIYANTVNALDEVAQG